MFILDNFSTSSLKIHNFIYLNALNNSKSMTKLKYKNRHLNAVSKIEKTKPFKRNFLWY